MQSAASPLAPLRLYLLFLCVSALSASRVLLISSSGCYSHDVMMKEVGSSFDQEGWNVTWMQTRVYGNFKARVTLPGHWGTVITDGYDEKVRDFVTWMGPVVWEQHVPTDLSRPWKWRGSYGFIKTTYVTYRFAYVNCCIFSMLHLHQINCRRMLESEGLAVFVREKQVDLVVLDHFLQECLGGLTSLFDVPVVQFSNYPVSDGYITYQNVPSSPAAVPRTGTPFSGQGMSFLDRLKNSFFDLTIRVARNLQTEVIRSTFANSVYKKTVDVPSQEAARVVYAGRSEFLADSIRPISNRIKHFGCSSFSSPSDHVIILPRTIANSSCLNGRRDDRVYARNETHLGNECFKLQKDNCLRQKRRQWLYSQAKESETTIRKQKLWNSWSAELVDLINTQPFVIVSFGSVVRIDEMPDAVLDPLISALSSIRHVVIWQISGNVTERLEKVEIPDNIHPVTWVPLKEMFAHPNLEFAISHGGINTVNELIDLAVPIIGFPTQGDQYSNVRRLVDLGIAEMADIHDLKAGKLKGIIEDFQENLHKYWQRTEKFSSMVRDHRRLSGNTQRFWLQWTIRYGNVLKSRNILRMKYVGDEENVYFITLATIISFMIYCLVR